MFVRLLFAFSILLIATSNFYGCMCGHTSVCDAYSGAAAIVVAKVIKFEPAEFSSAFIQEDGRKKNFIESGQEVTLDVSQWFKGNGSRRLKLLQPNSTCDWSFDESNLNKEYLFYLYLNKDNKNYALTGCGRSSEITKAGDDLSWLSGLPKSLRRTRISGSVNLNDAANTFPALPGVSIKVKGKKNEYSLTSNEKGVYELWDIPAGKYRVSATIPANLFLSWTTSVPDDWTYFWSLDEPEPKALDVKIEAGKCGGVNFMFENK